MPIRPKNAVPRTRGDKSRYKYIACIVALFFMIAGCGKKMDAPPSVKEQPVQDDSSTKAPAPQNDKGTDEVGDDVKSRCNTVPNSTTVVKKAMAWGYIQKTIWDMGEILTVYDEIPVFTDQTEANKKINDALTETHNDFMLGIPDAWELSCGYDPKEEDHHHYYRNVDVRVLGKFISVDFVYQWYMGGGTEFKEYSYIFNTATGERLKCLTDIYGLPENSLKLMIKKSFKQHLVKAWEESKNNDNNLEPRDVAALLKPSDVKIASWKDYDDELSDHPVIDWEAFNAIKIEDFNFTVNQDGNISIIFSEEDLVNIVKDSDGASFFAYDSLGFVLTKKPDALNEKM